MTTPLASWMWERGHTSPAQAADERVGVWSGMVAADAHGRQHELERCPPGSRNECAQARGPGHETAFHIASRSGATPNQRSNASAPCSMSIGRPSTALMPAARAARTHAVPPLR